MLAACGVASRVAAGSVAHSADERALLRGRLIDTDGSAFASRRVAWWFEIANGNRTGPSTVLTDANGALEIDVRADSGVFADSVRWLHVARAEDWLAAENDLERVASVRLERSGPLTAGPIEIGDLRLPPEDPPKWFRALADDELDRAWREERDAQRSHFTISFRTELLLGEMAHRATPRCIAMLEEEAKRVASAEDFDGDRQVLADAMLRRARRQSELVRVVVDAPREIACTFPELPALAWHVDAPDAEHAYEIETWERARHVRVDVNEPMTRMHPCDRTIHRGPPGAIVLGPRGAWSGATRVEERVFPRPGTPFDVRIVFGLGPIDDAREMRGRCTFASEPLRVTIAPLVVANDAKRDAELRVQLLAIDVKRPVQLVDRPWTPGTTLESSILTGDDRVFEAGWSALPMLLDALDDASLESARVDWVLALLHDVTGWGRPDAAFSHATRRVAWPGSVGAPEPDGSRETGCGNSSERVALLAAWRAARAFVVRSP